MKYRVLVSLCVLTLGLGVTHCSGKSSSVVHPLAADCRVDSDCNSGLVCTFLRCHEACQAALDCPAGQRCVIGPDRVSFCQLDDEKVCKYTLECTEPLVCAADGQCRNQCERDRDCSRGQLCAASGECAEPMEVDNTGHLIGNGLSNGGAGSGGMTGANAGDGGSGESTSDAGSGGSAGARATAGSGGSSGSSGSGGAAAGAGAAGAAAGEVILPVGSTGLVSLPALGIQGAWQSYGDGLGIDGTVATSDCVLKGMHLATDCSTITTPPFGTFPQTIPGKMCTAGTVAKVINSTTCSIVPPATTPPATCPDYSNLFGAGIRLDLSNAGSGADMKVPFNATLAGVIGISFDLDAPPLAGVRVEFPTVGTEYASALWKPAGASNLSPLVAGHNVLLWSDVKSPSYVKPAIPFNPSQLLSISFHVPTKTSASAPYAFCISNLAVITGAPAAAAAPAAM